MWHDGIFALVVHQLGELRPNNVDNRGVTDDQCRELIAGT